jgi:hypothetical protein
MRYPGPFTYGVLVSFNDLCNLSVLHVSKSATDVNVIMLKMHHSTICVTLPLSVVTVGLSAIVKISHIQRVCGESLT